MTQKFTTVAEALAWAEDAFTNAGLYFGHGTHNAWDEAVALTLFVLDLPIDAPKDTLQRPLTSTESEHLFVLFIKRIQARIPAPYLTNQAWFCGLPFYVDTRVIVPRSPIAELITQGFAPWVKPSGVRRILDLCCGSACIAISCAYAFPEAKIDAIDVCPEALAVASINVAQHQLEDQVRVLQSDLFSELKLEKYDIIISNPPYVDAEDFANMPAEYEHEPVTAFVSGTDGLDITRAILREASGYLSEEGILVVEVGNSASALVNTYKTLNFTWLEFEHGGEGVFLLTKAQLQAGR